MWRWYTDEEGSSHFQSLADVSNPSNDATDDSITIEQNNDLGPPPNEMSSDSPAAPRSNSPDVQATNPRYVPPFSPLQQSLSTPAAIHPNPAVYILYVLVLWLHTMFHLPFRACNAVLTVFAHMLAINGTLTHPPIMTTLPSILSILGGDPTFCILPVCPRCLQVHPSTTPCPNSCKDCQDPLFYSKSAKSTYIPRLQFPHKPLEEQLHAILSVPGMEDALEAWRKTARQEGKYNDIFDGAVCKEIKSHDGGLFFDNVDGKAPDNELRIGVTLGVDW
jgi:hypothetical protein